MPIRFVSTTRRAPTRRTRARRGTTKITKTITKTRGKGRRRRAGITRRPRVISFQRSATEELTLNTQSPPTGWTAVDDGLCINYVFGLSEIDEYTSFTNLFSMYRLKGVRIEGYFSNTVSDSANKQTMMYYCQNYVGAHPASDLTEQYFLNKPIHKRRVLVTSRGKAFSIYCPLNQLAENYSSATNTDYGVVKPRWVSTTETSCPHYGMSVRLQRLDDQNWTHESSAQYPTLKIIKTYYFQMRGLS